MGAVHATTTDGTLLNADVYGEAHITDSSGSDGWKFVWKDASETALNLSNQTSTVSYTDLDLTNYTSTIAKMVYLQLRLNIDTAGGSGYCILAVRKNGTTPDFMPLLYVDTANVANSSLAYATVAVGMDSDQIVEYALTVGSGWQVDAVIAVLGYWE